MEADECIILATGFIIYIFWCVGANQKYMHAVLLSKYVMY